MPSTVHSSICHERDNGGGVGLQARLIVILVDACLRCKCGSRAGTCCLVIMAIYS
jgi:hypothetical protein